MRIKLSELKRLVSEVLEDEHDERLEVYSIFSDVYKEHYGIRPRHIDWRDYTIEELKQMLDDLYADDSPSFYDQFDDDFSPGVPFEDLQLGRDPGPMAVADEPGEYDEYESLPKKLGMKRAENTVGYEKRSGGFAGDTMRKMMKVFKGR